MRPLGSFVTVPLSAPVRNARHVDARVLFATPAYRRFHACVLGLQGPVLGVIDVIVAAMERHRSVIRVAEYGLWCTENVSYIKEHKVHTNL